jgi:hypothetical protein
VTVAITQLDLRVIERVLDTGRGAGYVLDFSDPEFAAFFADFGVNINDPRYATDGGSKWKRLRSFLRTTRPPLAGRVLAELLKHRLLNGGSPPADADRAAFAAIANRLGGTVPPPQPPPTATGEDELLKLIFQPATFERLAVEDAMSKLLVSRMEEASRCVENRAYLAAIILCGSVLEGMCLGYGVRNPEAVNRGYVAHYGKAAPPFYDWKLSEWIEVLGRLHVLSQNVVKFGTALRDFRNYVHPSEQFARKFEPDRHTARIGFQVVVAAAEDLAKQEAA